MKESSANFTQLNNKPLREQVVDILRDAMLNGDLKPGQMLVETELAAQLGVSRAPIREALQRLQSEGFLDIVPYHGTTVRHLTRRDIEELYSLRSSLETFALRRVAERDAAGGAKVLHGIVAEMLDAAKKGDLTDINRLDRRFHNTIIELSDHNLLQGLWNNVSLRVRQVMSLRNAHFSDLTEIARNHLPIVEALEAGNIDEAASLLSQHIAQTGDLIASDWMLGDDEDLDEDSE